MFKRVDELMADFRVVELMGTKPNYAELGRKYGLDPRTVKKYHDGYEGKPKSRDKPSILDKYLDEITKKISIPRTTLKGVWECLVVNRHIILATWRHIILAIVSNNIMLSICLCGVISLKW